MKTTEQNNRLIAEFMGFKLQADPNERFFNQWFTKPTNAWVGRIEILHFDSSWDWLMPVVAKITRDEEFIDNDFRESVLDVVGFAHIDDTYSVVVKFIEWYNEQKF